MSLEVLEAKLDMVLENQAEHRSGVKEALESFQDQCVRQAVAIAKLETAVEGVKDQIRHQDARSTHAGAASGSLMGAVLGAVVSFAFKLFTGHEP